MKILDVKYWILPKWMLMERIVDLKELLDNTYGFNKRFEIFDEIYKIMSILIRRGLNQTRREFCWQVHESLKKVVM